MAEEHDLSMLTLLEGCYKEYSLPEFTEHLNVHHLSSKQFDQKTWLFWTPEICESLVQQKIKCLLGEIKPNWLYVRRYLIQFWAPKVVGNQWYLTTSDQPFGVGDLCKGSCWYWKYCVDHRYIVDERAKEEQLGAVGRVFLNGYPESSPDLRLYSTEQLPFRDHAARCGFGRYLVVPVFDLFKEECYGVLEVLVFGCYGNMEGVFSMVERALQEAGLRSTKKNHHKTNQHKNWMLPKYNGRQAKGKIAKMLEAAIEVVPQLHIAQVWVPCKECANANSNFCYMERAAFVTATNKTVNSFENMDFGMTNYLQACEYHNLQAGKGPITTTVMSSSNKSCFCRNICDFGISENPLAHYAQRTRLSFCLALCLDNVHNTEDHCFVEFFLQCNNREDSFGGSVWHLLFGIMEMKLKIYKVSSLGQQELIVEVRKNMLSSFELVHHNMSALRYGNLGHAQRGMHQLSKEWDMLTMMKGYKKRYSSLSEFTKYLQKDDHLSCLKPLQKRRCGWLFWSSMREEVCEVNSCSSFPQDSIQTKIKDLLGILITGCLRSYCLVQFWAPKMNENRRYLETSVQPFAIGGLHQGLAFFRKQCAEHRYFVDERAKEEELGPPGRVFRSGRPEMTHDLRLYSTTEFPLKNEAAHCNLRRYIAFPVSDHQHRYIGVLEFVEFGYPTLEQIRKIVEEAHLSSNHVNFNPKFKNSSAKTEIRGAFELINNIPQLHMLEVWLAHNCACTPNSLRCIQQVSSSSLFPVHFDLVETRKGIIGMALASGNKSCFCRNLCEFPITEESQSHRAQRERYNACFAICLQSSWTGDLIYVLEFFLVQGPRDYEYLWSFLYFVLPILKQKLKSFKVASGQQLGEELVVDIIEFSQVNQPTSYIFGRPNMFPVKFHVVQYGQNEHQQSNDQEVNLVPVDGMDSVAEGKQRSAAPADAEKDNTSRKIDGQKRKNSLRISLEDLEPHFGKRLKDVEHELGVSRSTIKRKCRSYSIQRWPSKEKHKKTPSLFKAKTATEHDRDTRPSTSSSHLPLLQNVPQTNTESTQRLTLLPETDVVIIKAKYEDDIVKFQLSLSSGMDKLAEEVATRLNLEMGSFKLKYVDEDNDEILLTSDVDLKLCIKSLTATRNNFIKVIVQLIHSK